MCGCRCSTGWTRSGRSAGSYPVSTAFLSPKVTRQVLDRLPAAPVPSGEDLARVAALNTRERETLVLLSQGLSNAEIGARLWVTEETVCANRVQAAMLAQRAGLLDQRTD